MTKPLTASGNIVETLQSFCFPARRNAHHYGFIHPSAKYGSADRSDRLQANTGCRYSGPCTAGIASPNLPSVNHGEAGTANLRCYRTNPPTREFNLIFTSVGERSTSRASRDKNCIHLCRLYFNHPGFSMGEAQGGKGRQQDRSIPFPGLNDGGLARLMDFAHRTLDLRECLGPDRRACYPTNRIQLIALSA
jgi:hypothetical protein